jgi:hypothetical protein
MSDTKKPFLERQTSVASESITSSARKSSISSVTSNASGRSDVSKYSSASFIGASGELLSSKRQVDASSSPVLRRTWTDLRKDPGLKSLKVQWTRLLNAKLQCISSDDSAIYEKHIINGIPSQFQDGNLTTAYARSLRLPASEYVILFDIKTRKGILTRKVRLSHCNVVRGHDGPVLHVLSRMQAGLAHSEKGHAISFPARCILSSASFSHGLREKHALSGKLQVNLNIVDPGRTIQTAKVYISAPVYSNREFSIGYWNVRVYVPNKHRPEKRFIVIPFPKLDHQNAFPDRLKEIGTKTDIDNWIGDKSASRTHDNLIATDIKFNMLGGIVSAELKRIKEPFIPILECDAQPVAPTKTGRFGRR